MSELLKLNLGCGHDIISGFINVDRFGSPDVLLDLELFPWPWETNTVAEVRLKHVLEHLGETTETYFGIIKELYRVCASDATIEIRVPHPRHDDYLTDPTHVRPITPNGLHLFSKKNNRHSISGGYADTPLGLYLDVDFELVDVTNTLDEPWASQLDNKQVTSADIRRAVRLYNNVVKEVKIVMKVVKQGEP